MYRIPFVAGSMAFSIIFFLKAKYSLSVRLMPLIFLGSFSSLYHYHIGQYGVYKNIDSILGIMTEKGNKTEVSKLASEFV
jgi:glucan phosphoethanolaminetransferase (alkaline phosphatase superfamily)